MNVVLIGEEAAGLRTLQSLEQGGVRGVTASPRRQDEGGSLWDLATKLGHTTWPVELVNDPKFAAQVRDEKVGVVLEWILVRQVYREGICIPAREARKVGDRADA